MLRAVKGRYGAPPRGAGGEEGGREEGRGGGKWPRSLPEPLGGVVGTEQTRNREGERFF